MVFVSVSAAGSVSLGKGREVGNWKKSNCGISTLSCQRKKIKNKIR
jgi:hypothetical protein